MEKIGSIKEIKVDSSRIIQQLSTSTIKDPVDAIVELVTNSDDSYRRLEEKGVKTDGYIGIVTIGDRYINNIICVDHAEGMSERELLSKALVYAASSSGFDEKKHVRGLFGRGLKEAIFGLGEGEITSIKDDKLIKVRVFKEGQKRNRQILNRGTVKTSDRNIILQDIILNIPQNGTCVNIKVDAQKLFSPISIKEKIEKHFALRDILSSPQRHVFLTTIDRAKNKITTQLHYVYPEGKCVVGTDERYEPRLNNEVELLIKESNSPLEEKRFDKQISNCGILIDVEGAVLDNVLFKYESEPAAYYFFGRAKCNKIADYLRKGDFGVLSPDRSGIAWNHPYCKSIKNEIESALKPLIEAKQKELEKGNGVNVPRNFEKVADRIAEQLSNLWEKETEEFGNLPKKERQKLSKENPIIVKPEKANLEVGVYRPFSVYVSSEYYPDPDAIKEVEVSSDNPKIVVNKSKVELGLHKKYSDLYYGVFKVESDSLGELGNIQVMLDDQNIVEVPVAVKPQKKSKKKKKLNPTARGRVFNSIQPNRAPNPIQRVRFNEDTGNIEIFTEFPLVKEIIGPAFQNIASEGGRILLVELLIEVFARTLAINKIQKQGILARDENTFLNLYDEIQKKYSEPIKKIVDEGLFLLLNGI